MKKLLFWAIFVFLSVFSFAQVSKKAKKFFYKAKSYYFYGQYDLAELYCKKAIKKTKDFFDPYLLLSQIYYDQQKYRLSSFYLLKAINLDTSFWYAYVFLAENYMNIKSFDSAFYFCSLVKNRQLNYDDSLKVHKICDDIVFRKKAYSNPLKIKLIRLPSSINTTANEYFPTISADNSFLIFTRLIEGQIAQEDMYISYFKDSVWTQAQAFPQIINTPSNNEGAHTMTPDGKIMIFTRCIRDCDLYFTEFKGGVWTRPVRFPYPINTKYWDSQPCLASDGKTLYFSSNRPGGKGGKDIWKTVYLGDGQWSEPVNLSEINTPFDEMSPFIHFDNKTLYFASDGYAGLGGYDIFMTRLDSLGHWQKPINLGFPINSPADDIRLVVSYDGKTAYYSTNKNPKYGQDIFMFKLPKKFRPTPTIVLKINILDSLTLKPIKTDFLVVNLITGDTIMSGYSDHLIVNLPIDYKFSLNLTPKGYMFFSKHYDLTKFDTTQTYFETQVLLKPILNKESFILKNLFFDFNSYKIKEQSYVELDKLAEFMKKNPKIKIQIVGHTDSVGSYEYNMELSEKRAKAVAEYLIKKGISAERISYKGMGYTQPIATNRTEEGRKKNRRTEIVIFK